MLEADSRSETSLKSILVDSFNIAGSAFLDVQVTTLSLMTFDEEMPHDQPDASDVDCAIRTFAVFECHLNSVTESAKPISISPPSNGRWVAHEDLLTLVFGNAIDRNVVQAWFEEAAGHGNTLDIPWWKPGWWREATDWIDARLEESGFNLTSPIVQLKNWYRSCLLRLETDNGTVYFKSVPSFVGQEPAVTRALALQMPVNLPQLLATDEMRGWMLMRGIEGTLLAETNDIVKWAETVRFYAQFQVNSIQNVEILLASGWHDERLATLTAVLEEVFAALPALTAGAASAPSSAELQRIQGLLPQLLAKCASLISFRLPDTAEHGDFHAFNIIFNSDYDRRTPIFFDWADACISHPFFCIALCSYPAEVPNGMAGVDHLREVYLAEWHEFAPIERLREAFELAREMEWLRGVVIFSKFLRYCLDCWDQQPPLPYSASAWAFRQQQTWLGYNLTDAIQSVAVPNQ